MSDTPMPQVEANDATNEAAHKKSSKRFVLYLIAILLLIAGAGYWLMTQSGADKALVEKALKNWQQQLEQESAKGNVIYQFAYGQVEMVGATTDRHAVVKDVVFSVREKDTESTAKIKTATMEVHPRSVTMDQALIRFAKPFKFVEDGKKMARLTLNKPLDIEWKRAKKNGVLHDHSNIVLPTKWLMESLEADDNSKMQMVLGEGSVISASVALDHSGHGVASVSIPQLQLQGEAPDEIVTIAALTANTSKSQKEGVEYPTTKATMRIKDLMASPKVMPYGAVSFALDAEYTGPTPKTPEEAQLIDWTTTKANIKLKQVALSTSDAALQVNGDFSTGTGDLLPVGKGRVQVRNFAFIREELRKHGALDANAESMLNVLLSRMTGAGLDKASDLDVVIAREAGKPLQMGKITFEEAMMIVLTGGKMMAPPPAMPANDNAAPAAPKKAQEAQ